VNVTLPEEMKARYDLYQAENKARPLNLSAILQAGLDDILKKEGY
jgi:post-segregation antitoxin (ccd killing protein)